MYLEKLKLDDRVAVVTGGGRAIGLACVQALAEAGASVVIADFDAKVAEAGRAELKRAGSDAEIVIMDVTKSAQVTKAADDLFSRKVALMFLSTMPALRVVERRLRM